MAKRSTTSPSLWLYTTDLSLSHATTTLSSSLSLFSLFFFITSLSSYASSPPPHFEGFGDEFDEIDPLEDDPPIRITDLPPPSLSQSDSQTHHGPPQSQTPESNFASKPNSHHQFDFWDEEEFEGIPVDFQSQTPEKSDTRNSILIPLIKMFLLQLIRINPVMFRRSSCCLLTRLRLCKENENLALAWAAKFATKDTILEKNFSLLGVGEGEDSPLLLKEGQNVFKFYASGRRYCQGLLATLELKSRHDLISRMYNALVPCKDEISIEVYMNDEAMDQVVFAVAKKKASKAMLKEVPDLQKFASLMSAPTNKKWVAEDLSVVSESKEVAGDLITEVVLDQARSKTDATRVKAAQEAYKELQNARQENLQKKKAERKKLMEEAEAKLSAESIRKKEAKERSRQMKKAMPKMKMTRGS
ncbi:hypothetical protein RDABS01_003249 [Bienertia sinuspersici]